MKILMAIPGKLKTVPMGGFSAKVLRDMGHSVVLFDYWPQWKDKIANKLLGRFQHEEQLRVNKRFRAVVDAEKPDIVFALYGFHLSVESLTYLKKSSISSVCWWLNDPFQFERSLKKAHYFDYVFTNSKGSVDDYKKHGVNAFWLPTACDPSVHKHVPARDEYRCDVCFAGDWSPLREQWLTQLAQYYDVKIFGPWGRKIASQSILHKHLVNGFFSPNEMVAMFSSAKIVLNIHTWYGKWTHGTNPRLFEAAGCGAAQAVDWKDELPDLFDCDKELLVYQNLDDLTENLASFLQDDERRIMVGKLSQKRAYAEHSYEQRMKQVLSVIG